MGELRPAPSGADKIILKGIGGFYYVETPDGVLECRAKGIFRRMGVTPLAGDLVELEESHGDHVISEIYRRINSLKRPPVANVSSLFLVVSAADPAPNRQVVDRMTAVAAACGIDPVLLLTKTDLAPADEFARDYRLAGYRVIDLGAEGSGPVLELMQGGISVFEGNTGVGKSTFINSICPGLQLKTGEISRKLGRGRHTTRAVELYPFEGGYIADTPGFSSLEEDRAYSFQPKELENCFPEFRPYLGSCFFSGCSHRVEKGCAVLEALREGRIVPSRHRSYCEMYEQARQSAGNYK